MADITTRVELNGLDRRLMGAARRVDNFRTPLTRSETFMEQSIGKRFRSAEWAPLSPATIKWHPHRAGGKPLNDTGALKMSITSGAANKMTKNQLNIRSGLKKANMLHYGGRTSLGTTIPSRKFLYFSDADERMIKRIFEDYIEEVCDDVN